MTDKKEGKHTVVEPFKWYHVIYGSDDGLRMVQDFERDQSSDPDVEIAQWLRYILLAVNIFVIYM